jgi:hypothetical protein
MRKISGIRGDDDEQPANKSAGMLISDSPRHEECGSLQSNMIAIAIRIINM